MLIRMKRLASTASISSYIHTTISMCEHACKLGHTAYVDFTDAPMKAYHDPSVKQKNQWDWHLDQPYELVTLDTCKTEWTYFSKTCPEIPWALPWNASDEAAYAQLRDMVPKWLKLKQHVIRCGNMLFEQYGLRPENTIAISVRGADKVKEIKLPPIERYFAAIDPLYGAGMACWLKPECAVDLQTLRNRYPDAVVMPEFPVYRGDASSYSDLADSRAGWQKSLDALTMIYMMSRCAVLVKNAGNSADLAIGLGTGRVIAIVA